MPGHSPYHCSVLMAQMRRQTVNLAVAIGKEMKKNGKRIEDLERRVDALEESK